MPSPIIPAMLPSDRSSRPISARNAKEIGRTRTSATSAAISTSTPSPPRIMAETIRAGVGRSDGIARILPELRRAAGAEEGLDLFGGAGEGEEVALADAAAGFGEELALRVVLDAFGDDFELQAAGEGDQ